MLTIHDNLIAVASAAFALMGVGSLAMPLVVTRQFGVTDLTIDGRNEVRAVYGGFGLAMCTALISTSLYPDLKNGICFAIALALAGMAAGRLLSAAIDRSIGRFPLLYLAIESAGSLALFYSSDVF
jgi:hypothetical protein